MTADPDAWWASLPYERRCQIHRWIEQPAETAEVPGQVPMFDPLSIPFSEPSRRHR